MSEFLVELNHIHDGEDVDDRNTYLRVIGPLPSGKAEHFAELLKIGDYDEGSSFTTHVVIGTDTTFGESPEDAIDNANDGDEDFDSRVRQARQLLV